MIPSDRPNFVRQLVGLAAVKPGKDLTPEAIEIWWQSMQDWSLEDFKAAAAHLAKSIEFMPSPYHFEELRKDGRPTAGEAWITARSAIGSCHVGGLIGYGPGGTCGDPLIDRVVQMIGGYRAIAMCDSDKLHFLERRFAEHYADLQDAHETRTAVPQIANSDRKGIAGPASVGELLPKLPGNKQ